MKHFIFHMIKRFLTFALSVGFFIWLPSAFADGNGVLSLDAPATFRQVQTTEGSPLLTLRVDNIQVRAEWEVTDAAKVFTINAGVSPNEGVLRTTVVNATDTHVATIYAVDKFELLNPSYANLTASAVITVVFESGVKLSAPRLTAVVGDAGDAANLHTFVAEGGSGNNTYTLVGGNDADYFDLDKDSGVLSLQADSQEGVYTLTVQVTDGDSVSVVAVATVELSAALMLADAPLIYVVLGATVGLHKFIASGGIGRKTYILTGEDKGYFSVDANSGVLSLLAAAQKGVHMLTVQAIDEGSRKVDALATVRVSAALMLADAPSFTVIASVGMNLHRFIASGGIGTLTYAIVSGDDDGHFALGAASGVLSLRADAALGRHTLTVQVADAHKNTVQAVATVEVSAVLALADAPSFTVIASVAMSLHTFISSGGIGAPTYTIVADNEDGHFALNANSGVLSLLAGAELGAYVLTVRATDEHHNTAEALVTVEVSAALSLADASSLGGAAGTAMSLHTFVVEGGIGARTYILVAGEADGYFSLGAESGVLSLLAVASVGIYTLSVQVKDEHGNMAQALATVEVRALYLANAGVLYAIEGRTVSLHTFAAQGGSGEKIYILVADKEEYFTLGMNSGVLSVLATAPIGIYTLTVKVEDEDKQADAAAIVEVRASLSLVAMPPLTVIVGRVVHTLAASGGIGIHTYTILSGDEGGHFVLGAASGVLSLRADAALGRHLLTVQVMDARKNTVQAVATVEVSAVLVLPDAPSFTVIASVGMNLHTFIAGGGIGTPTYAIMSGNEKEGFTLNAASGVLSLSVNAEPDNYVLNIEVTDARGNTAEAVATVGVSAVLSLADAPRLTVVAGEAVSVHTFSAKGGIGNNTYTLVGGDDADYFDLDKNSGVLSLLASAQAGVYTLTVQVADADGDSGPVGAVATVGVSAALALSDAPPFTVIAGVAMSLHKFIAGGGIGAPTYAIVSGNEEGHFDLGAASGVLSLAADAEPDRYVLRIQVTDARDNTDEAVATVGVSAMLSLADAPRLTAVAGEAANLHTFVANGGIGNNTYTLVGGDDADYFDLDKNSGVLSLQVSAQAGVYTLTVQVADDGSGLVEAVATVGVSAALMLADAPLLSVALGAAVSLHKFTASGGIGIKTYTLAAGDKDYFSVDAGSGVLSLLTTAQEGVHMITVQAIDEGNRKVEAVATVRVSAALMLADAPLFTVIASAAMSLHTFIASGGIGTPTYTILAGNEKEGFTLNAASGVLSLQADAESDNYVLRIQATDAHHNTAEALATVGVSAVLALADAPLLRTIVGEGGNLHTFAATGGIGDKTYTLVAGNEGYFSLDRSSGVLAMSADVSVGMYTLSVQATDAEGNVVPALATVKVGSLLLRDVMLYAIVGREVSVHTFEADGGSGAKVFTIVAGNEDKYFTLDAGSGVLSVQGSVTVGIYTLAVAVDDEDGNRSEALAVVAVESSLFLADTPSLVAVAEMTMSLHTFAASGGIGAKTYTLAAVEGQEYFTLNAASGVLSVVNATVGVYTLSVTVSDSRGNSAQARGTVEVVGILSLADVSLEALARLSVEVTVHTFTASGGYGAKRYEMIADESDYFALADSGELSLPQDSAMLAGEYTLFVAAADSLVPPQRATAAVVVRIGKNGIFVMGGENEFAGDYRYKIYGDVWFSLNDESWSKLNDNVWRTRYNHQVVAHQGWLYVLGGDGNEDGNLNDVWASADGKNWLPRGNAAWSPRSRFQAVEYQGRIYVLGGAGGGNNVWSSADGTTWRLETGSADWDSRSGHQAVVHQGRLYVLGGWGRNDVWSSADGKSWRLETGSAGWSKRGFHQAVSHQGRLYVLGGLAQYIDFSSISSFDGMNDVWSSADGKSWRRDKGNNNSWSGGVHQALSRNGLLYVLGGRSGRNDVWSSADGQSWTKEANAGWPARYGHQAVVFPPPLVIGGGEAGEAIILALGVSAAEIYTVTAQYGLGPYTYSLTPENIGINIDGDGVLLMNDQAQTGAYVVTVRVEDKEKSHAEIIINIEIYSFALADAPPLFVFAGLAERVSVHAFTANHGAGAYTYTLVGDDSGYFTLGAASGVLSVTANVAEGVYTLSVEVSDERAKTVAAVATVEAVPILSLADAPLMSVIISRAVSLHTFTAVGGSGTKTYNLVDAPGFFTLGEASGILSVQAFSEEGVYTVSVEVSDESGQAAAVAIVAVTVSLLLADAPPLFVFAGLSEAVSVHAFTVVYGVGASTYKLVDDSGYFTLGTASGVLSVTANVAVGVYTLSVGVSDEIGKTAAAVATVEAVPILSLADAPPRSVIVGRAVSLHTFTAVGGSGTKTYNLVDAPGFFTLGEASGILSVQAISEVGIYTVSVQVGDESGQAVAVAIVAVAARLSLADASLLAVEKKAVSLHTFAASGGIGARTYTLLAGNETGYFVLDASGGVLSLSASASPGTYALTVGVMDERGNAATAVAAVNIAVALSLADAPPLGAAEGYARDLHTFVASGGIGVKTYTLVAGAAYFTVGAASGVLSVNASAPLGIYTLSVQAEDADGNVAAVALATVEVVSLFLLDAPMLYAIVGQEVSLHTFEADGGSEAKVFTIVDGNEDMYFTLVASSGVLSVQGNATVGIYTLAVAVNDEDGNRAEGLAVVAVEASLFLADMPLLTAFTEITMSLYTFAASGGIGAKTYTLSAVDGQEYFTLNATSGVLSALDAALGVYTLSVTVSDSRGNSVQARGTVEVFEFLSLADVSLVALARLSVEVTLTTFAAGGGYGAKRYTMIVDESDYFALDADSGELSLPSNSAMLAGAYTLLVGVSDSLSSPQRATAAAAVRIARNGIFVLGGNESQSADNNLQNDVWWSVDGVSWRENTSNAGWTARENHQVVAHRGRMYLMGGWEPGSRNDVWSSLDGKNWSLVTGSAGWSARGLHQALVHNGRMYVLGGGQDGAQPRNDVWSSADGVTWREDKANNSAGWTARWYHQALVHNGRMYVLGGYDKSDVWSSADGSSWRFEGDAAWGSRHLYQAVSHAGRLYVLGGIQGTNFHNRRNDVWSSLDGRSWVEEKANNNAFWAKRDRHQALSRDGLLYVLGGNANSLRKDVWSSSDGKSWTEETSAAGWGAREYHQALVFPPNLALSGTSETIILTLQAAAVAVALHTVSAQYGFGEYTYSLSPEIEGINIDGTGVLSADGDAQAGAYALTVRVEDEEGGHAETIVNIELRALALADAPPLFVIAGLSESVSLHAFTVSHEIGAYTYDLVGDESGYFTLGDASGVLSVTANVAVGGYTLSVAVSDESGHQATAVATVEAVPMLSLADAPLLSVVAGKALELHTFIAAGGIKAKTYNLVDAAGYFTLGASSGILSVQAVSEVGIYTVSVGVSDSVGNQATAQATVGVTARLSLAGASLMAVEKKAVSLHTFVASGGIGARTYTLSAGNETGYFVLDAASGVLSLSASASAGEYTLTVGVKDERSNIAAAVATVNISAALSLADAPLLPAAEGEAKNLHTFVASGGLGVKTYTLVAGAEYFTIGAASGVLSVDANAPLAIYTLSVQVADADGNVVQALATAQVVSLLLADVMLYAIVGREVSLHTFEAGGGGGAKTYTIVAGNEDKYFTLDAVGVLSVQGSATVGVYTLSIAVDDEGGNRAEALAVVAVEVSLFLADAPPLTVMAGLALSLHTFAASDGIGVKAYTVAAGNEAKYFTLNAASGVLSLRATAPEGFHTLTVQAADEDDNLAEAVATVDVSAALSLAEAPLLEAVAGMTMSVHTFTASGGIGAKTHILSADNGAGYFAMNATSGVLSVANATVGVYTLSVQVSDSRRNRVEARATVQVSPPMSLADAPPLEALARLSVMVSLHTFVASDGIGSKRYTVIADEAGYFALDAVSGELSLPSNSAMLAGAYTLRVGVSDGLTPPQRATAAATVQIARNGIFVLGGNESHTANNDLQNDVWSSTDGESWRENTSSAGWTARENHQVVTHRGRMYLMGGFEPGVRNDVWSSLDGKNWSLVTGSADWTARGNHQALVHNGRMYVLGGWDTQPRNDVWSSADGENWKEETGAAAWSARRSHQAVSHNGRLYVLGGKDATQNRNDVWSSADGANWRFEGNAEWTGRWLYEAVSHNGRLYILGGNDGGRRNDVWSSLDGRSWVEEKSNNNAFWTKRGRYQALSRDGLLYVLGGNDNSLRKDVWSSSDGKNWTEETSAAGWEAREYHQAVVFPPNLVLSGSSETIILTLQAAAVALHTLSAQYGGGQYAYSLPPEIEGFSIDGAGVLLADGDAQAGAYALTVRVEDEEGSHAETIINVDLRSFALADAPPLFVFAGAEAMSLHVFTAIYGFGKSTYNLVDDSGYFTLGTASGVLSVTAKVAVGVYTLSVVVSDENNNQATAVATVEAEPLSLADAPPLEALVRLSVAVALHTFAAAGIGSKRYTLIADQSGYFALDADSGELSLPSNSAMVVGAYTLLVGVSDSMTPPQRATAAAAVRIVKNGIFVLGGNESDTATNKLTNDVWWSAAGESWREDTSNAGWTARENHQVVAHRGRMYLMGGWEPGSRNDVWSSMDGKNWSLVTGSAGWSARGLHQVLVHNGRMYVLGGGQDGDQPRNDVWSSADGVTWREDKANNSVGWSARWYHQALVHNGRMYVLGGYDKSDVWSSADGSSWRFEGDAAWGSRHLYQVVSHAGRLYVLGGIQGANFHNRRNDVWSSLDGRSWVEEKANNNAFWTKRDRYQALSRDGLLYVLGGNANGLRKDVWSSSDGKNWTEETSAAGWEAREYHRALVFPPNLALSGSSETITLTLQAATVALHTVSAQYGFGQYTYSLPPEIEGINIDGAGVLSADNQAQAGVYEVTVRVEDEEGGHAETIINVDLRAFALADAPPLSVFTGAEAMSLHVFTAIYGVGKSTYNLVDDLGYFTLGTASGVLSVTAKVAGGVYTLSVEVSDENNNQATAVATVEAVPLSLADAPSLEALARLSVAVTLHTFVASGGIGSKRYTILAGNGASYFALDADSGELSLPSNSAMLAGAYTLRVGVSDSLTPPQRATAAATVQIARNGIFVLGGNESQTANNDLQNDVWSSTDGVIWRENTSNAGWTARENHQVVAHRGRMYLMGGFEPGARNDVWSSVDGKNWSLVTGSADWSARGNHQALVHNGRMYVMGGSDGQNRNDVWSSADGVTWREDKADNSAGWSARGLHRAVAHNGRMYVTGGWDRSDVWSSADGSSWRFEGDAAWGPRHLHQAVSHAGRLYVLGGIQGTDSNNRRNDVWSSLDGRSWVEEKANNNAFWAKRDRYQALSRDGLLYVLGGNGNSLRKDVWSSSDGKSWTEETSAAGWGAREYHQAVVFPPDLALSGTSETITLTVGMAAELHTFSAQHGGGQYTYSLPPEIEGFEIDVDGVLSADDNAQAGVYLVTVRVEDEEGSWAETVVQVEIIAASTAALSAMERFGQP